MSANPLISSTKASESGLHAALHPLVLLTISDYITRHTLRKLETPLAGALLGQQNGREITIEHAYDVKLLPPTTDGSTAQWLINEAWFEEKLLQYRDVHKDPALDLVGWWTLSSNSGPGLEIMELHRQVMKQNESAVLLTFQPEAILSNTAVGGKLPLTIYETVHENIKSINPDASEAMQVEGEEASGEKLELRLRELRYEIATGEAEMISVDFVARGGGNATAIESALNPHAVRAPDARGKGKVKDAVQEADSFNLNPEEEECK
jgi:COP9 signalosome complex subunit 6